MHIKYIMLIMALPMLYGTVMASYQMVSLKFTEMFKPLVYASETKDGEVTPRTILIGTRIDWTQARIVEEIHKIFPDEPRMVEVAYCESGWDDDGDGKKELHPEVLVSHPNGFNDCGLMQINLEHHGDALEAQGLDCKDVQDNLKMARQLYDESKLQPWSASKSCWNKK